MVAEDNQFVDETELADTWANVMERAEQVAQMGKGGKPGVAPGIVPPAAGDSRKKQGRGLRKIRYIRGWRCGRR